MKIQTSFEFMIYLMLSAVALMISMRSINSAIAQFYGVLSNSEMNNLVSKINYAALSYTSMSFDAYLPDGVCNAKINNSQLSTEYGNFTLGHDVKLQNATLCPDKTEARFDIIDSNGFFVVSRVR